jgi:solute carrier family 25 oxoglutarate transporter 11
MPEHKVAKIAEPFVCGGTAATMASIAIHPMDLAKVSGVGNSVLF